MSKYRMHIWACLALLVFTLIGTLFGYNGFIEKVAHAVTVQKCGQWSIIPSANPTPLNQLSDVAVISANDAWTVGNGANRSVSRTLAEHWNGKAWKAVSTPNIGSLGNYLRGVIAFSANNVWAVGDYQSKGHGHHVPQQTLIEHWNGTAWKIIASPNMGDNYLVHVAAVSTNDIWAVGYGTNKSGIYRTLVEHYDGTAWKVISSPNIRGKNNMLNSVGVVSANDVWSAGTVFDNTSQQTLIEHWNGSSWQIVASPNPGSFGNYLEGIGIVSAKDVWSVGGSIDGNSSEKTLVEHWDGTRWAVVASPSPMSLHTHTIPNSGGEPMTFFGVAVISANSIWAVGDYPDSSGIWKTMIEHWNGKSWSLVPSPNVGSADTYLRNAARIGNTAQVWAVGYAAGSGNSASALTEFYC